MHAATIGRRLGAAAYDLLVVCALWILSYFVLTSLGVFSPRLEDNHDPRHWLLRAAIAFLYFGWCWTRGGRTLGLLAWKLAVVRHDGAPVTWRDAALRFGVALGYLLPVVALEAFARGAVGTAAYLTALLLPFVAGTTLALHERPLGTRVSVPSTTGVAR